MSNGASAYRGKSQSLIFVYGAARYPEPDAVVFIVHANQKEMIMAKGQARSNREKKKPKADKVPGAGTPALTKGMQPPIKIPTGKS